MARLAKPLLSQVSTFLAEKKRNLKTFVSFSYHPMSLHIAAADASFPFQKFQLSWGIFLEGGCRDFLFRLRGCFDLDGDGFQGDSSSDYQTLSLRMSKDIVCLSV
jgi:hypothetical protein